MKQNIIHIGLDVDDTQYHGAAFNKETGEVIDFKCRLTLKGLLQQLNRIHRHALGAQSGLYKTHDTDGCSDSDPEIWWGAQSQHPFSYAISGWGVHRWFYWASHVVSTGKGTKQR